MNVKKTDNERSDAINRNLKEQEKIIIFFTIEYGLRHVYMKHGDQIFNNMNIIKMNILSKKASVAINELLKNKPEALDELKKELVKHINYLICFYAKEQGKTIHTEIFEKKELLSFYKEIIADRESYEAVKYLYEISYTYGLYISGIYYLGNVDYRISTFGPKKLDSYNTERFPQKTLIPTEFIEKVVELNENYDYEIKISGKPVSIDFALLFDFSKENFNIQDIINFCVRDITLSAMYKKMVNGFEISHDEWKLMNKYNPSFNGEKKIRSSFHARIVGFTMWDLLNLPEKKITRREAFDRMIEQSFILGYSKLCKDELKNKKNASCTNCINVEDCFTVCCKKLDNAIDCIKENKILPLK
ncbi:hypothetical protein [Desulfovibrio litoralis]|uniref:Uncharacterized protein n=1 Tax=Desulfovibrio litoralis DSM 11393 TaxID=1121455 RepID=A0A1M7TH69_9BACT|nr:hypothetical protein [Desulfovibrio litoralis]SHN70084.1 hypothetical protein SAMN02745728_01996 [Desulfovibrio litoralis DSM 11393]